MDNGIKIFNADGEKLSRDLEKKIEKLLETDLNPVSTEELGKARRFDESGARYIEFCKSTVPQDISFASLRIVLDCANGACYKTSLFCNMHHLRNLKQFLKMQMKYLVGLLICRIQYILLPIHQNALLFQVLRCSLDLNQFLIVFLFFSLNPLITFRHQR